MRAFDNYLRESVGHTTVSCGVFEPTEQEVALTKNAFVGSVGCTNRATRPWKSEAGRAHEPSLKGALLLTDLPQLSTHAPCRGVRPAMGMYGVHRVEIRLGYLQESSNDAVMNCNGPASRERRLTASSRHLGDRLNPNKGKQESGFSQTEPSSVL